MFGRFREINASRELRKLRDEARASQDARWQERRAEAAPVLRAPPELAGQTCEASCPCGVKVTNTVQVFLDRVARNRTRCARCGNELRLPAVVSELVERLGRAGSAELAAEVEYGCPSCARAFRRPLGDLVRMVQRDRARCQLCGDALELPAAAHEAAAALAREGRGQQERSVACPICDRGAVHTGGGAVTCAFCGASFAVAKGADRGHPPPLELEPASPGELAPFLKRIRATAPAAATLLAARAKRGEVTIAEAVILAARLESLAPWSPRAAEEASTFPFPPDEAVPILATLVAPGAVYHTDRRDLSDGGVLFIDLGTAAKVNKLRAVANVLSLATLALGGGGVFYLDVADTPDTHELCLELDPDRGGTLIRLGFRKNSGKVRALPAAMKKGLQRAFAEMPAALSTYLLRLALFGPWAKGKPLFLATAAAARARLQALGLPLDLLGPLGW